MENFTHPNAVVSALLNHRSTPAGLLDEPAPTGDDLKTILQCGLSAPDHAAVQPWKFITIEGEARHRLGEVFVQAKRLDDPNFPEKNAELLRAKPLRAPLIVAVAAHISEGHPKAPRVEQVLSAGVAAQHMQIAMRWLNRPWALRRRMNWWGFCILEPQPKAPHNANEALPMNTRCRGKARDRPPDRYAQVKPFT